MTSLRDHQSNTLTKLLIIGDPKSGKTGSLVSLVKVGYKLRILDLDNLLDILKYLVLRECPELIDNVEARTLRDKRTTTPLGSVIDGTPTAFINSLKLLDRWKYDDIDFGKPSDWGPDCIVVIDSLSRLCDAAYDWAETMVPRGKSGDFDARAVYGVAQDAIESCLATLTSRSFGTNVIVIAHVQYMDLPDGSKKGFPQGIGSKLSPKIPSYFPSVVYYKNSNGRRTLQTNSSPLIDCANPAPFLMEKEYPAETGLAQFFGVLRPHPTQETTYPDTTSTPVKPSSTLIRK